MNHPGLTLISIEPSWYILLGIVCGDLFTDQLFKFK